MKKFLFSFGIVIAIAIGISIYQISIGQKPVNAPLKDKPSQRIETVANNLEVPWEFVFLPNGDILLTERTGALKIISNGQTLTIAKIPDVKAYGEGGLMGLALHPNFSSNNYIYLYYAYSGESDQTLNRVVLYKFSNNSLSDRKVLIDNIPGAINHNGGRLKFGPDGFLYITTGDSLNPSLAQDKNSLAGKILRVTDEGKPTPSNPFKNQVYSYGHRNPQGLSWDNQGRLWATEHGQSATDEVNLIVKGKNYGWPLIRGDQTGTSMETPFAQSGQETWAPAGAVFLPAGRQGTNGSLFFGGLRGQALFELKVGNGSAIIRKYFLQEFGRIRDVVLGPDGFIYISTSNRDGRGNPRNNDDKILKIDPSKL